LSVCDYFNFYTVIPNKIEMKGREKKEILLFYRFTKKSELCRSPKGRSKLAIASTRLFLRKTVR
jgi:hypothetical protein